MLDREEYIEQAYFFRALRERMQQNFPVQDVLDTVREEILSTTKLPMAIDFLASELRLEGRFSTAMTQLSHYFTPLQTYIISEAENDRGSLDMYIALEILEREANYRAEGGTLQGIFLYQFECICHNRLSYDQGLGAIAQDPAFDKKWRQWIMTVRRQIGIIDFADLLYVRSEHYVKTQAKQGKPQPDKDKPVLFGEKEGKLALANRLKDPLLLFSALHRQLGYPAIPRPKRVDRSHEVLPTLVKKIEQLATRLKLLEEEVKGGIDVTKFYMKPPKQKQKK